MKYNACVTLRLSIDYDDIEADSEDATSGTIQRKRVKLHRCNSKLGG